MNNSYVQQNLNSIKHMLGSNMETLRSIKNITKEDKISSEQMQAIILMGGAGQMYSEIKDYLTDDEVKEIKALFTELDEIISSIKL